MSQTPDQQPRPPWRVLFTEETPDGAPASSSAQGLSALCEPHKNRKNGRAVRDPWAVSRKFGKKRRYGRKDPGDEPSPINVSEVPARLVS